MPASSTSLFCTTAPRTIYLHGQPDDPYSGIRSHVCSTQDEGKGSVQYVRADLAESQVDEFKILLQTTKAILRFVSKQQGISTEEAYVLFRAKAMDAAMQELQTHNVGTLPAQTKTHTTSISDQAMYTWPSTAGQLAVLSLSLFAHALNVSQGDSEQPVNLSLQPPLSVVGADGVSNTEPMLCVVQPQCDGDAHVISPALTNKPSPEQFVGLQVALQVMNARDKQISKHGHLHHLDDQYLDNELEKAAASYMLFGERGKDETPVLWPWTQTSWNPKTPEENLQRALALGLAALEALERKKHLPVTESAESFAL